MKPNKDPSLDILVDMLQYRPTEEQQEVKAAFWANQHRDDTIILSDITLARAYQVTGDSRLAKWWSEPGFKGWFSNKDEFKQKIEHLLNVGLQAMNDLLRDPEVQASAKVKAFEVLAKLADREPVKVREVKFADKKVQEMTPAELRKFIQSKKNFIGEAHEEENDQETNTGAETATEIADNSGQDSED